MAQTQVALRNNLKLDFLTKPNSLQPGYLIYKFVKNNN
jgi:hypothetical protein